MTFNILPLLLAVCAFAAPIPAPAPTPQTFKPAAWTDEPQTRGTVSIISTCCVTLGLCVWTAIHPDILVNGNNKKRLKQKLRMSIKALMMPEDILAAARIQWQHARQLHRAMVAVDYIMKQEEKRLAASEAPTSKPTTAQQQPSQDLIALQHLRGSPDSESTMLDPHPENPPLPVGENTSHEITQVEDPPKTPTQDLPAGDNIKKKGKKERTVTQDLTRTKADSENLISTRVAYFVVMGGFVNPKGKTVTCEEFWRAFVRDPERLKDKVSYKEITDKGNASMLAKLIVCFQGLWFLIQLMGRAIAHKTIALLELHVAIHILIAAGIYVLWWNKSLDVNEPIVLDVTYVPSYESGDDNNQDGFAPWWMMPTLDTHPDRKSIKRTIRGWLFPPNKGEIGFQSYLRQRALEQIKEIRDFNEKMSPHSNRKLVERCRHCANGEKSTVHSNLKPTGAGSRYGEIRRAILKAMPWLGPDGSVGSWFVKAARIIRRVVKRGTNEGGKADEERGTDNKSGASKVQIGEKRVHGEKKVQKNGEKNGAMIITSRARREVNMRSITTCLFYICYAGLHSTAWNAYFPTDTEKWIWRGSCLVVGIVPALLLLFYVIVIIIQEYDHDPEALRKSQVAMGIILGMVYLAAAGALLIEAFISLRMADPEIYQKVPVSVYLPHF